MSSITKQLQILQLKEEKSPSFLTKKTHLWNQIISHLYLCEKKKKVRVKILLQVGMWPVTNSTKQDNALNSQRSFTLSKFEGRLKGWFLMRQVLQTLELCKGITGLRAPCQRKGPSPSSPTQHSLTFSLHDLVAAEGRDTGNATWPDKPVHQMMGRTEARKELRVCVPDPATSIRTDYVF